MSEADIPIDIHAPKLLDWLVSRRHVSKDWMTCLQGVRALIVDALKDMPEDPRISFLLVTGHQLNYYTCKQIVEILKQTEADSKNIFGYYSSQRMKDWQEIVKAYEKDNVYLAEIAQIINRNVTFEVPSMKRAITKADTMCDDLRKKAANGVKRSNQLEQQFIASAEALGITGTNLKEELLEQLEQFPTLMKEVEDQIKPIGAVRQFYVDFVSSSLEGLSEADKASIEPTKLCPVLDFIVSRGNTSYYEYRHGVRPESIEAPGKSIEIPVSDDDAIDFGDKDEVIDFGDDLTATGDGNGNGSGSSNGASSDGFVHVDECEVASRKVSIESVEEDIDWNVETTSEPIEMISESIASPIDKVARGIDALSLVECNITRDQLLDELCELQSFLEQRLASSCESDQATMVNILFMSCGRLTQLLQSSPSDLKSMIKSVSSVFSSLTSDRLKVLYLIRDNPKYIENTVDKLNQKKLLAEKALKTSEKCEDEIQKIVEERNEVLSKIQPLIQCTRELEERIADDISTRYKGRQVNIMAGSCML